LNSKHSSQGRENAGNSAAYAWSNVLYVQTKIVQFQGVYFCVLHCRFSSVYFKWLQIVKCEVRVLFRVMMKSNKLQCSLLKGDTVLRNWNRLY